MFLPASAMSQQYERVSSSGEPASPLTPAAGEVGATLQDGDIRDPLSALPLHVVLHIWSLAYLPSHQHGNRPSPFRAIVPRVCRAWRAMLATDRARELLLSRVRLHDGSVPRPSTRFAPALLRRWFAGGERWVRELEVDITPALSHKRETVEKIAEGLIGVLAEASGLHSLRLIGALPLDQIFCPKPLSLRLEQFAALHSVYLSGGGDTWGIDEAAEVFTRLPALQRLLIRFAYDTEAPPADLPAIAAANARGLRQLSLIYPARSALPPVIELAEELSELTQLTALKLRRVPMASIPDWLPALSRLQHLYWDPYLPADVDNTPPPGIGSLTSLRSLWMETLVLPLSLPSTLSNLENLQIVGKANCEETGPGDWEWLRSLGRLKSLRLQGAALTALPDAMCSLDRLTRLSLMVNKLSSLPQGDYLGNLRCLHLGSNRFTAFPSALTKATSLRYLFLANQLPPEGSAPLHGTLKMRFRPHDLAGLIALPRLHVVICNLLQPEMADRSGVVHEFAWIAQRLRTRSASGARLTSDELQYHFQDKSAFDIVPLPEDEAGPLHSL